MNTYGSEEAEYVERISDQHSVTNQLDKNRTEN